MGTRQTAGGSGAASLDGSGGAPDTSADRGAPRLRPWGYVAAAVHAVVFAPVILSALFRPTTMHPSLWVWHAARIPETFHVPWRPVQAHFGWAAVSRLVDAVLPTSDPRIAGAIVSLAAAGGFGAALWFVFTRTDQGRPLLSPRLAVVASVVVALLEAPPAIQGWQALVNPDTSFVPLYFPFVPTTLAAMGLNVMAVWGAARVLDGSASRQLRRWLPLVVVAAAVAKPNVVPMLGVMAPVVALAVARGRVSEPGARRSLVDILALVSAPAMAVTALQFVIITWFSPAELQGTMDWRPFWEVRELGGFGWQFWLVGLLPVVAVVLLGRRLLVDKAVLLSVASFALALWIALMFARGGDTPWKGAVGGDIIQLAATTLAMVVIFTIRRLVVLRAAGQLRTVVAAIMVVVLLPYLAAGLSTWRCHSGLAECYPPELGGAWPQDPLPDP
jgi:hypothetical protein